MQTTAPVYCSLSEFSALNGWAKSYTSKLKADGRLVITEGGQVDVAASLQRIKASTGAPERAAPPVQGVDYASAQDRERFYSSELKRLEYERETRRVLMAEDVLAAVAGAGTLLRAQLEAWPPRLAPLLAGLGGDEQRIRQLLEEHVHDALTEMAHQFGGVQPPSQP